jgi:hypothetical protein
MVFRIAEEVVGTGFAMLISAVLFGPSPAVNPGASPASLLLLSAGMGVLLAFAFAATRNLWFAAFTLWQNSSCSRSPRCFTLGHYAVTGGKGTYHKPALYCPVKQCREKYCGDSYDRDQ